MRSEGIGKEGEIYAIETATIKVFPRRRQVTLESSGQLCGNRPENSGGPETKNQAIVQWNRGQSFYKCHNG